MKKPPIERFLSKIKIIGNCWMWQRFKDKDGYSRIQINKKSCSGHRFIYEYYHGDIDPNLMIDHLCRKRACVNPEHLELVTPLINTKRGIGNRNKEKTRCPYGHEYSGISSQGKRICKICRNKVVLELYHKRFKH